MFWGHYLAWLQNVKILYWGNPEYVMLYTVETEETRSKFARKAANPMPPENA
jgi:hypothetical protein